MARNTITQITDDLDGSPNAQEVGFSFNGIDYVIDLSKKNRAAFEKAMKPYLEAARKVPRNRRPNRKSSTAPSRSGHDLGEVRRWARGKGIEVSDRGRVSAAVLAQYEAEH